MSPAVSPAPLGAGQRAVGAGRHGERERLWARPQTGDGPTSGQPRGPQPARISRASFAVSVGVLPTLTPAASSASFFAWAVPDEPETMAPA
ncbi:hypothetical protein RKD49_004828 [Streptomyces glaucescens]